jgi:Domain of unknown function (DUF5664)
MSEGSFSKATTSNPKDLLGNKKVSISKFPLVGLIHGAHAMMNGADKYGPYNWREKDVIASIYVDAALRHLIAWFEREEIAEDSGVHHLGHAEACCAILLDAQENGNLIDDRPKSKTREAIKQAITRIETTIANHRAKQKAPEGASQGPIEGGVHHDDGSPAQWFSHYKFSDPCKQCGPIPTLADLCSTSGVGGPIPCGEDIPTKEDQWRKEGQLSKLYPRAPK